MEEGPKGDIVSLTAAFKSFTQGVMDSNYPGHLTLVDSNGKDLKVNAVEACIHLYRHAYNF